MAETYGWAGKILRVNLTTGEITTQDDEKYHKYIGGMGMAYRIMYEEAPMELDPYDEKALVIFGVGPLTGAGVPCSGRMNVTFRSTWSKGHSIIDAHMGGHIGSMLKYAGYDGIVVSGISEKPVYLRIEDGEVSLEDASEIWGKGTFASNKWMVEQNGREFETASIGPAGEHLVDYSTLNTSFGNSGGAGLGAAMGNKKLKGLAIRGTGSVKVADPKKVLELSRAGQSTAPPPARTAGPAPPAVCGRRLPAAPWIPASSPTTISTRWLCAASRATSTSALRLPSTP